MISINERIREAAMICEQTAIVTRNEVKMKSIACLLDGSFIYSLVVCFNSQIILCDIPWSPAYDVVIVAHKNALNPI